jgi:CpcD/allophycocyanin linker domain
LSNSVLLSKAELKIERIKTEFGGFFMAMMTGDRLVLIEVMGGCNTAAHQTNHSVRTPYSNMSSTIQRITQQGGKILKVTVVGSSQAPIAAPAAPSEVAEEPQKKGGKSKKR